MSVSSWVNGASITIASWYGGYLGADIWRINSGVSRFERENGGFCLFYGYSGSIYKVNEKCEGMTSLMSQIHDELITVGFGRVPLKDFEEEFRSPLH